METKNQYTDPLEQLLQETFQDHAVPEFTNSWAKIKARIRIKQFFQFSLSQLNVFTGVLAPLTIIGLGMFVLRNTNGEVDVEARQTTQKSELLYEVPKGATNVDSILSAKNAKVNALNNSFVAEQDAHSSEAEGEVEVSVTYTNIYDANRVVQNAPADSSLPTDNQSDEPLEQIVKNSVVDSIGLSEQNDMEAAVINDSAGESIQALTNQLESASNVIQDPVVVTDTVIKVVKKRRKKGKRKSKRRK